MCYDNPDGGIANATNDGSVAGTVAWSQCPCLAFYRDVDNNLKQIYWSGAWYELTIPTNSNVSDADLALDETNDRIYYIGIDGAVYYYNYNYSTIKPTGVTKLGFNSVELGNNYSLNPGSCYNASSCLTLSNDKKILYYKGADGYLWYYFTDQENRSPFITDGQNWNRDCILSNNGIQGPVAVDQANESAVYYVADDATLHWIVPVAGDNPFICPLHQNSMTNSYRMDTSSITAPPSATQMQQVSNDSTLILTVFPNPSENAFSFVISNISLDITGFDIKIEDLQGIPIFASGYTISTGSGSYQFIWNASNVSCGVYFYNIKTTSGKTVTGKLVKL